MSRLAEPTATITSIHGAEPMREREYPACWAVGYNGVTRIEKRDAYRGDHSIFWFDIYADERLVCSVNERFVSAVNYKAEGDPTPPAAQSD